jgi:Trk K+ transport system NAD-binding subunit
VVSFAGIWLFARPLPFALYETLLDVAGSAVPDEFGKKSAVGGDWQRLFQVAITLSGVVLMPVVTAVFVEGAARRGVRTREPGAATRGHVIVFGLGNAGLRVALLLHELGIPVVGIDRDPGARGIAAVGALEIPVVAGERPVDEALRRAHIERARAIVALTGDDVSNLELSLEARAINQHVRIVVRLFDDNFARHITAKLANTASRSASSQAAPAFAAAMMGGGVLGTLPVGDRTLLVVAVEMGAHSKLLGKPLSSLDKAGHSRVLALRRAGDAAYRWHPAERSRPFVDGDVVVIAATRAGLGELAEPAGEGGG